MKKPTRPPGAGRTPIPAPAKERAPTYDDLLAIARLIESGSRFSEFRLRSGDIEVEVKRANGAAAPAPAVTPAQAGAQSPEIGSRPSAATAAAGMTSIPEGHLVKAPMVGTFYRSPAPDKPPFVEVGTRVEADTIVCIIEVMKLMNSVTAGVAGVVTHVLAQNAQPVEAGQPVIAIKPA